MCLIVVFTRCLAGCPLLVGANREERYERASAGPRWLGGRPDVFAGQDRVAGGTWLGVNEAGLLAAVTNRPPGGEAPGAAPRSRGLLCLDALRHPGAEAAVAWCRQHLHDHPYAPFNLLLADRSRAFVIHGCRPLEVVDLPPGLHLLGEAAVDDPDDARLHRARRLTRPVESLPLDAAVAGLQVALGDADPAVPPRQRLCRRGRASGTVSASVIALPEAGLGQATFLHAPGPPDQTPFSDLSAHLRGGPPPDRPSRAQP